MKFSGLIVGAFAAMAAAAPAPSTEVEKRSFDNFSGLGNVGNIFGNKFIGNDFNNLLFKNQQLQYIANLGFFKQDIIQNLILHHNLGFDNFQNLFLLGNDQQFGLEQILGMHSLSILGWCANQGFFNNLDFRGGLFPSGANFGLLNDKFNGIGNFNFGLDVGLNNQIATIVQQSTIIIKE